MRTPLGCCRFPLPRDRLRGRIFTLFLFLGRFRDVFHVPPLLHGYFL